MSYQELHKYLEKNGYEEVEGNISSEEYYKDFEKTFEVKGEEIKVRVMGYTTNFSVRFINEVNQTICGSVFMDYSEWEQGLREMNEVWRERVLGKKGGRVKNGDS